MVARLQHITILLADFEDAHRQTVRDGFRNRHRVWLDAEPLIGKIRSRTRHATLDFIQKKQQVVFITQLADAADEIARHRQDAAFALHRLQHHGDRLVRNQFLHGIQIIQIGE